MLKRRLLDAALNSLCRCRQADLILANACDLHELISRQVSALLGAPEKAPLKVVVRACWSAHCIERCAWHARRAADCKEVRDAPSARHRD